jgi:DNA-3-methyladenine glycosylase
VRNPPQIRVLRRSFYSRPTVQVARDLLGKLIAHQNRIGRIVETEAYLGADDAAAHSAAGITPRTRVIFGPPGHAYVYLSYGIHNCLNVVAEPEGTAGCVLIRAVEPVTGIELPADGPGKLTRALGITLAHNGCDVTHGPILIGEDTARTHVAEQGEIAVSRRIGITKSSELPLRFFLRGNPYVSRAGARVK